MRSPPRGGFLFTCSRCLRSKWRRVATGRASGVISPPHVASSNAPTLGDAHLVACSRRSRATIDPSPACAVVRCDMQRPRYLWRLCQAPPARWVWAFTLSVWERTSGARTFAPLARGGPQLVGRSWRQCRGALPPQWDVSRGARVAVRWGGGSGGARCPVSPLPALVRAQWRVPYNLGAVLPTGPPFGGGRCDVRCGRSFKAPAPRLGLGRLSLLTPYGAKIVNSFLFFQTFCNLFLKLACKPLSLRHLRGPSTLHFHPATS